MSNQTRSKTVSPASSASVRNDLPQQVYEQRRTLLIATSTVGVCGIVVSAFPFLASMTPSERARALGAPVDVNVATLKPGELHTESWRGRPVWILKRTPEMIAAIARSTPLLADPSSERSDQPKDSKNQFRSLKPELAVILGVCTHLGCTPNFKPNAGDPELGASWPGGFYCPCHGSLFDLAGRVFKDVPAPTNLEIPPYRYLSDSVIRIGEQAK